jgi:dTDP-glucose 4,6-dehydratase
VGIGDDSVVLTAYDRPDHDRRYAVDPSRMEAAGWLVADPWERFAQTVEWYRTHAGWWLPLVPDAESIYRDSAVASVGQAAAAAASAGGAG